MGEGGRDAQHRGRVRACLRERVSHDGANPSSVASGTDWLVDPKEELAVVYLSAAPGPIRWHYRKKINALVYQSMVE